MVSHSTKECFPAITCSNRSVANNQIWNVLGLKFQTEWLRSDMSAKFLKRGGGRVSLAGPLTAASYKTIIYVATIDLISKWQCGCRKCEKLMKTGHVVLSIYGHDLG